MFVVCILRLLRRRRLVRRSPSEFLRDGLDDRIEAVLLAVGHDDPAAFDLDARAETGEVAQGFAAVEEAAAARLGRPERRPSPSSRRIAGSKTGRQSQAKRVLAFRRPGPSGLRRSISPGPGAWTTTLPQPSPQRHSIDRDRECLSIGSTPAPILPSVSGGGWWKCDRFMSSGPSSNLSMVVSNGSTRDVFDDLLDHAVSSGRILEA